MLTRYFSFPFINCVVVPFDRFMTCFNSPVKREIKTMVLRRQTAPNSQTFLTPDMHKCGYQGVRNISFFNILRGLIS